ncbi:Auxin-binding protein ABP19b [Linum perenne]
MSFTVILLLFSIISSYSHSIQAVDFCVADLNGYQTPSGYVCKNPTNVTVDDFVFSGLVSAASTKNRDKAAATPASVQQFPGLNGLNLAAARFDLAPGGVRPLHVHPHASELIYVVEGTVTAGFVSGAESNTVYVKQLKQGEIMVFPQGLVHFQVNTGNKNAVVFATFGNADPGVQVISSALFGNNFESFLVEKTTNIDVPEIKRLKALLGGSG